MKLLNLLLIYALTIFIAISVVSAKDFSEKDNSLSDKILLKSRQFIPNKGLSIDQTGKTHFLIQLERFPTKEERKTFENAGIKLLDYIPNKAWFISISGTTPQRAVSLPNVKWVGDVLPEDKISLYIREKGIGQWAIDEEGNVYLNIKFYKDISLDDAEKIIKKYGGKLIGEIYSIHTLTVSLPNEELIYSLAEEDSIQWINEVSLPIIKELDQSRPRIGASTVQATPYNLNGSGINIMIYDDIVYSHSDFGDRLTNISAGQAGELAEEHATHVAGIIAGDGSINSNYKGIAPKANIIAYVTPSTAIEEYNNTAGIESDYNQSINQYNAIIAVNPWGFLVNATTCNYMGDYESQSELFDNIVRGSLGKVITIIFAAGNERDDATNGVTRACGDDPWGIWNNFHTINPPKAAKNIIAVGAVNSNDDSMTEFSGWGPIDDGRIKPDVVAPACQVGGDGGIQATNNQDSYDVEGCGTSFAAPHTAGAAALMLQQYNLTYGNLNVLPSTIKSLVIHTSDDLNNTGPDYTTGWGRINITSAVDVIKSQNLTEGNLSFIDETDFYNVTISQGESSLKVTLVWDDEPATPNAAVALINDINLVLIAPNGSEHYPWRLNPYNPWTSAARGMDHINNIEQVYIANPDAGKWTIQVNASALNSAQNYSIVTSSKFTLYNNTLPSTPTSILCDGSSCNSSFYKEVEINCSGSVDNESNEITYFIEANYTDPANFSIDQFNNSWLTETLIFNGDENITVYLSIPKEANVTSATIKLEGLMPSIKTPAKILPENDTIVDEENPITNYGSATSLNASLGDYQKFVLMKFDLTKIHSIKNATLVLYIENSENQNFNIRRFKDFSWDEYYITWDRMDQDDLGALIVSKSLSAGDGYWLSIGINSYIQERISKKASIYMSPSGGSSTTFTSKESPIVARRPYLNVTYYNISSPEDPYLEVGTPDGTREWNHSNIFNVSETTNDFSSVINSYLSACIPINGNCEVPFLFHSEVKSKLRYSDLNITYKLDRFWQDIGNHTPSSTLNWNITVPPITGQNNINLRCKARDVNGINIYSEYFTPIINLNISSIPLTPVLNIENLTVLYSNSTTRVFELWIHNIGIVSNVSWSFDSGSGENNITSNQNITLEGNESAPVIIKYTYSSGGQYTVTATATSESITNSSSITISVGDLIVTELNDLYTNNSEKIFEFKIKNNGNTNLTNINWSFDTSDNNILYANELINLSVSGEAFVYIQYNYSSLANHIVNATVFDEGNTNSKIKYITYLNISNFNVLNSSLTKRIFEFRIKNLYSSDLTGISWNMTLGDGNSTNSTEVISLIPNEQIFVLAEHNYTSSGSYVVNATAVNGTLIDSQNITVDV